MILGNDEVDPRINLVAVPVKARPLRRRLDKRQRVAALVEDNGVAVGPKYPFQAVLRRLLHLLQHDGEDERLLVPHAVDNGRAQHVHRRAVHQRAQEMRLQRHLVVRVRVVRVGEEGAQRRDARRGGRRRRRAAEGLERRRRVLARLADPGRIVDELLRDLDAGAVAVAVEV